MGLFLAGTGFIAFVGIILLLVLAFEVWMFVELIQDNWVSPEEKILWAVGMFLFTLLLPSLTILFPAIVIKTNS